MTQDSDPLAQKDKHGKQLGNTKDQYLNIENLIEGRFFQMFLRILQKNRFLWFNCGLLFFKLYQKCYKDYKLSLWISPNLSRAHASCSPPFRAGWPTPTLPQRFSCNVLKSWNMLTKTSVSTHVSTNWNNPFLLTIMLRYTALSALLLALSNEPPSWGAPEFQLDIIWMNRAVWQKWTTSRTSPTSNYQGLSRLHNKM